MALCTLGVSPYAYAVAAESADESPPAEPLMTENASATVTPTSVAPKSALPILGDVQWYYPEVGLTYEPDKVRVVLLGLTEPGARIQLLNNQIPLIQDNKVRILEARDALVDSAVTADERGYFEFHLDLPLAIAQLTIKVIFPAPGAQPKNYQLNVRVSEDTVDFTNTKGLTHSPYRRRRWGVWGGAGMNFLRYKQQSDDVGSEFEMKNFHGPSLFMKLNYNFDPEWGTYITFNRSPGKTVSSANIQVSQPQYYWTYLAWDLHYYNRDWRFRSFKRYSEAAIVFGLQQHFVPFLSRSSPVSETEASVEINPVTMVALGGAYSLHLDRYWLFEFFMRNQTPVAWGSLFDVKPVYAFDGSVGVIHKWKPNIRYGVFWYGQWHHYKFSNHKDKYFEANPLDGPTYISGVQDLFFSNLEFRLGYEWD